MPVFALYLDEIGDNRLKVLSILKNACNLSFTEAKALLELVRPRLITGPKWQLTSIQQQLQSVGASASVFFYPEGLNLSAWAARISPDGVHCSRCGAKLFFAVPKLTTSEDIIDFAQHSTIANATEIAATGWIHPGVYCPNGCAAVLAEIDDID